MKTFLHGWLHSIGDAFAGGHFHWTPGLAAVAAMAGLILLVSLRARALGAAAESPRRMDSGAAVVGLVALAAGVALLLARHAPAAVKAAAKPRPAATKIITRTVTHTVTKAAPHFQVTGTEIVIMICVFLVAGVAKAAIRRGR
jgi:hypothetical protein